MISIEQLSKLRLEKCDSCPLKKATSILGVSANFCSTDEIGEVEQDFLYQETNQYRKKGDMYRGCGCSLALKPYSEDTQCPLGRWENLSDKK
jgi:hypothetical protein